MASLQDADLSFGCEYEVSVLGVAAAAYVNIYM
jgi:hypothetical protein